jgi:hypothetical protein
MLKVPHFGCNPTIAAVVRHLLLLVHDGYLWLGRKILIDTKLIWRIAHLSFEGPNPAIDFVGKQQDNKVADRMKECFGLVKGTCGYDVNSISNPTMRFAAHILAGKIMIKCRPNEVPAPVVSFAEQCAEGVQFDWSNYLLREFPQDCTDAQERGPFHYSWLLVLIALVAWAEPMDS